MSTLQANVPGSSTNSLVRVTVPKVLVPSVPLAATVNTSGQLFPPKAQR